MRKIGTIWSIVLPYIQDCFKAMEGSGQNNIMGPPLSLLKKKKENTLRFDTNTKSVFVKAEVIGKYLKIII
jgi:hypothetical protein